MGTNIPAWIAFYEEVADKLLEHKERDKRRELADKVNEILKEVYNYTIYDDKGKTTKIDDICPFTVIGIFNCSGSSDEAYKQRKEIAEKLAEHIGLKRPAPKDFKGIPTIQHNHRRFFALKQKRKGEDIDKIWKVFKTAKYFADIQSDEHKEAFIKAYDKVLPVENIGPAKVTFGLFWIRPKFYISLDANNCDYIMAKLHIDTRDYAQKATAEKYLALRETVTKEITAYELSYNAYADKDADKDKDKRTKQEQEELEEGEKKDAPDCSASGKNVISFIYSTSKKHKENAKRKANYKCKLNAAHETFLDSEGNRFMEIHHLVPMSCQKYFDEKSEDFDKSLGKDINIDVPANIISLCPNCHRAVHYGNNKLKEKIITKLFNKRHESLKTANIDTELSTLLKYYNIYLGSPMDANTYSP